MKTLLNTFRRQAARLKQEIHTLYLAYRDPRTPWYTKTLAILLVAYAVSPIDLIPDFVPVLGYLDDLVLLPLGIWLALHMLPEQVLQDCRAHAQLATDESSQRSSWLGIVIVGSTWICFALLLILAIHKLAAPAGQF